MTEGKTYKFGNGLYFTVNKIITRTPKSTRYDVSWWRTDEGTGKRILMEVDQDFVVPRDQDGRYKEVE